VDKRENQIVEAPDPHSNTERGHRSSTQRSRL